MPGQTISEIEELVLLAVGSLYPDAYAYSIKCELKSEARRNYALATIHTILYRLEKQGLLKSSMGGQSEKRGGRSKRLFALTETGLELLRTIQGIRQSMWENMKIAYEG